LTVLFVVVLLNHPNNAKIVGIYFAENVSMLGRKKMSIYLHYSRTCPNRCTGQIKDMTSRALINIYNDLNIKCSKGCNKTIKLIDLPKH
jgi:hypothetical protein